MEVPAQEVNRLGRQSNISLAELRDSESGIVESIKLRMRERGEREDEKDVRCEGGGWEWEGRGDQGDSGGGEGGDTSIHHVALKKTFQIRVVGGGRSLQRSDSSALGLDSARIRATDCLI